jgi:hypothetical protein
MDPNSYFVHQQYFVVFIGSLCVYNDFVVALPPLWKRVEIESGQTLVHGTWRGWFLKSKKKPFIPLVITPAISIMIRLHLFVERSREITEMHIRFPSIPLHPIICLPKKKEEYKNEGKRGKIFYKLNGQWRMQRTQGVKRRAGKVNSVPRKAQSV